MENINPLHLRRSQLARNTLKLLQSLFIRNSKMISMERGVTIDWAINLLELNIFDKNGQKLAKLSIEKPEKQRQC